MSTPVKVTKKQIRKMIAKAGRRYRGESPEFRYGYISALHTIGEDDGEEANCQHYNSTEDLREFYKLIGKGWREVYNA